MHIRARLQATFLQPLSASTEALAAANPSLAAMLEALSDEELERKCRWACACTLAPVCACVNAWTLVCRLEP